MTLTTSGAALDYELMRGGSELLDVALLAARGSAAARRVADGRSLDGEDKVTLDAIAQLLEASAKAVESFGPHHPSTPPPSGALAARVDVAIEAVLHDADVADEAGALSQLLDDLAQQVRKLIDKPDPTSARPLVDTLGGLASSALRETGHIGEITSTL